MLLLIGDMKFLIFMLKNDSLTNRDWQLQLWNGSYLRSCRFFSLEFE